MVTTKAQSLPREKTQTLSPAIFNLNINVEANLHGQAMSMRMVYVPKRISKRITMDLSDVCATEIRLEFILVDRALKLIRKINNSQLL